jgi:hypothetical protein
MIEQFLWIIQSQQHHLLFAWFYYFVRFCKGKLFLYDCCKGTTGLFSILAEILIKMSGILVSYLAETYRKSIPNFSANY